MIYESNSPEETKDLAKTLAQSAGPGAVYCLDGDLGAGKTAFAQGFATGLGITEDVTSPTFTILNEYRGSLPLYHFDVYRLADAESLLDIGCDDYFFGKGVCLVEWAELVEEIIPESAVWIRIERDAIKGEDYRKITVQGKEEGTTDETFGN